MEKSEEKERIENFQQFIGEVENELDNCLQKEKKLEVDLNQKAKIRNGIMNKIWWSIFTKLLGGFKVKITLYYNEKVIFEYEIPKE